MKHKWSLCAPRDTLSAPGAPSRSQNSCPVRWSRSEAFGPGSIAAGAHFPLLCSPTPSATLALFLEGNVRADRLKGYASLPESSLVNMRWITVRHDGSPLKEPDPCRHCCLYVVNFKSTQQNKNSWWVGAFSRAAFWLAVATRQTLCAFFLLVYLFKALNLLDTVSIGAQKTRLFRFRSRTIGQSSFLSRHEEMFWSFPRVKCQNFISPLYTRLTMYDLQSSTLPLRYSLYNFYELCLNFIFLNPFNLLPENKTRQNKVTIELRWWIWAIFMNYLVSKSQNRAGVIR